MNKAKVFFASPSTTSRLYSVITG